MPGSRYCIKIIKEKTQFINLNFYQFLIWKMPLTVFKNRGVATRGDQVAMAPLLQFPSQKRYKSFRFKHQGYCFVLTDVQKLLGPEISQFLPCMLQFLDNLWRLIIFSNYIGEINHFTLDLLKRSNTWRWTFWKVPFYVRKKTTMYESLNIRL